MVKIKRTLACYRNDLPTNLLAVRVYEIQRTSSRNSLLNLCVNIRSSTILSIFLSVFHPRRLHHWRLSVLMCFNAASKIPGLQRVHIIHGEPAGRISHEFIKQPFVRIPIYLLWVCRRSLWKFHGPLRFCQEMEPIRMGYMNSTRRANL